MLKQPNPYDSHFYDIEYYLSLEYRYFSFAHRSRVRSILSCLGDIAGKRILDIGGGAGYLAYEMQKRGGEVYVTDFSEAAISWGKARFPSLDFKLASVAELSSISERFDIVTAFDVIEHLESPASLLNTAKNALKPEGRLFISTDNMSSPFYVSPLLSRLDSFLIRFGKEGRDYAMIKRVEKHRRKVMGKDYHCSHISEFSFDSLSTFVENNGFKIDFFKTFHLWSNCIKNLITFLLGCRAGTGMVICCRIRN